jgi:zinc transport system substrate-binding protein
MDTSGMTIIALMDSVDGLEEEIVEGMEVHDDDDHGHDHDDHDHDHDDEIIFDEHVWTSPKNAMLIVRSIADVLIEIDPDNASYYNDNLSEYIKKLEELDAAFRDVVNNSVRRTIAFGDRFPFRYFAYEYGLDYFAAFPGCSTDTEPSAATVAFLINQVKALELPVVFHVELSNERLANTISEATGAKVMMLHASHNISRDDFLNNLSYIELMTNNISALREALH